MLIAQFTDLHIVRRGALLFDRVDTAARLRACVDALLAFNPRPDLLLLTGDLVDQADPEEYLHLRDLLAPVPIPIHVLPGNHDLRTSLRAAFRDHAYIGMTGPINYVIEDDGLRIIGLDSVVEGRDWGTLGAETIAWLVARLAEAPQTPTLVAVHHPPIPFGAPALDALGLRDAEALASVVAANAQIVAIVSGHYHRAFSAHWHGAQVVVAPSTAQAILLDFARPAGPYYRLEPPAFCMHRWDGALLASHVVQAGEYAGPYPYE